MSDLTHTIGIDLNFFGIQYVGVAMKETGPMLTITFDADEVEEFTAKFERAIVAEMKGARKDVAAYKAGYRLVDGRLVKAGQ